MVAVTLLAACGDSTAVAQPGGDPTSCEAPTPERLKPVVLATIPHPPDGFTEGLLIHDGTLFESSGLYNRSTLRAINPKTGAILAQADLPPEVFAEGLAEGSDGGLVQLTWKEGVAYRWAAQSLADLAGATPSGTFYYVGEGWGLTRMGDAAFVMSDGSDELTLRAPGDFSVLESNRVTRADGPATQLNGLEWDGESIWANRFQTDEIVRIRPDCWTVTRVADISALHEDATQVAARSGAKVYAANGIAHIPGTDEFLITGKLWPSIYTVRFVAA